MDFCSRFWRSAALAAFLCWSSQTLSYAEAGDGDQEGRITPAQLDELLAQELKGAKESVGDFLRRVSFDLVGRQPTPDEQRDFAASESPSKYRDTIERLLIGDEFGVNWANYWRDTIAYRVPPPELTYLNYRPLHGWLTGHLNKNTPWNTVVRELLTAKGKITDEPAATFVGYHQADPTNLASETSRIFLGQQILCAQCHDHPFDSWKRTQFHELAAFFARVKSKLSQNDGGGTVVSSVDKGDYVMPDVADPSKKGQKLQPAVLDGSGLSASLSDDERRAKLADWVTADDNPWFARAYTNRVWARLMGRGFYEPVDNLGDSNTPILPEVHQALAGHFTATGFDVKDLFRLIMQSDAYLRGVRFGEPGESSESPREPLRLRGDEVFAALKVGIELPNTTPPVVKPTDAIRFPPPPKSTQDLINDAFGIDPSLTPSDAPRTMGQALWMMNNEQLQKQINARPDSGTMLAKLLQSEPDNRAACRQMFSRVLAREPSDDELKIALAHIEKLGDRQAAFEDLLWGLVNSAEFTTRR